MSRNNGRVTLQALAAHKRLPADFLKKLGLKDRYGFVGIEYRSKDGEVLFERKRVALTGKKHTIQPPGQSLALYGAWRLDEAEREGFAIAVEGESDCWTLWHHGLPAMGPPGSNAASTIQSEHVEGLAEIYLLQEPGQGGETFVKEVSRRLADLQWHGQLYRLRMPGGIKDPSALHLDDPDRFLERMREAITSSEKLVLPVWQEPKDLNKEERLPWEDPIPLDQHQAPPPFPLDVLPDWMRDWVAAEAEATQTPPDLPGMLVLAIAGAALAKRIRVAPRRGWAEPCNLYAVAVLPPGERKSSVFDHAIEPVRHYEETERDNQAPRLAELQTEHRTLEARLKNLETKAAKTDDSNERALLDNEAKKVARELAAHEVPAEVLLVVDDITIEKMGIVLAEQGGRLLQASPEGGPFEIARGRYSEGPNFEVLLKGHSGDTIRTHRVGRTSNYVHQPALSLALTVQPDVLGSLADNASMRGRGLLARFLYSLPVSRVGTRQVAPEPMPESVSQTYHAKMLTLWAVRGTVDENRKPTPHYLHFSAEADRLLQIFERELEPRLADGEDLSHLAGWGNKLAGAVVRIAGVLHVAERDNWQSERIGADTVARAIHLGRDYLLPHALVAFGLMGADKRTEGARYVLRWLVRHCGDSDQSEHGVPRVSKRDIYQGARSRFREVKDLEPILDLLQDLGYLRLAPSLEKRGPGRSPSPEYDLNPRFFTHTEEDPHPHFTHNSQNRGSAPLSEDSEETEKREPHVGGQTSSNGQAHHQEPMMCPFQD